MTRSRTAAFLAAPLLLVACGAPQVEEKKPVEPTIKTEQQRLTNMSQVDLAVCFPKPPEVPAVATKEALTGLLVSARPLVLDCFVDPKNRGAAKETRVTIQSSINGGKIESTVSGENLSPSGQACVKTAIDQWLGAVPGLAGKAPAGAPVTAEAQFQHVSGANPTVQLGVNEVSDIAAVIRLAEPTWCDCYAEWKDAAPRALNAKIKLVKHAAEGQGAKKVSPAEVTFEPTKDAAADRVAACLQKKVAALTFNETSEELTLPYTFLFVHSSFAGPLGDDANPDLRFAQLDNLRGRRAAEAVIAVGARTSAAVTYDALVKKYKENSQSVAVDDLKARCADLLKADDGWIAGVERQLEIDEKTLTLATELKAKDPEWARVEALAQSKVEATRKDLSDVKKNREADAGICPKERK